jgi:hypothetical protein
MSRPNNHPQHVLPSGLGNSEQMVTDKLVAMEYARAELMFTKHKFEVSCMVLQDAIMQSIWSLQTKVSPEEEAQPVVAKLDALYQVVTRYQGGQTKSLNKLAELDPRPGEAFVNELVGQRTKTSKSPEEILAWYRSPASVARIDNDTTVRVDLERILRQDVAYVEAFTEAFKEAAESALQRVRLSSMDPWDLKLMGIQLKGDKSALIAKTDPNAVPYLIEMIDGFGIPS